MSGRDFEIAIIGGGIVGMATALALSKQTSARIVVLEAEKNWLLIKLAIIAASSIRASITNRALSKPAIVLRVDKPYINFVKNIIFAMKIVEK